MIVHHETRCGGIFHLPFPRIQHPPQPGLVQAAFLLHRIGDNRGTDYRAWAAADGGGSTSGRHFCSS